MIAINPSVSGVIANYFGAIGSTDRYYWVVANYPSGPSSLAGPAKVTTQATLDNNNKVTISWNVAPGAISYDVLYTSSSTAPTFPSSSCVGLNVTSNSFTDNGITAFSYTPTSAGLLVSFHSIRSFAVDGGAVGSITPANTALIPKNTIIMGGIINVTTAVTSAGSATVAIGTTAGSSDHSIIAATAKATLSLAAILAVDCTATPFKMSAAGSIAFKVATADLTAGVVEVFVFGFVPSNA